MVTTVGTSDDVIKVMHDLVELEYDALDAYESAIDKLKDAAYKTQLTEFRNDHQRHINELSGVLRELGHEPPTGGDIKRLLTTGKVALAQILGDGAILRAMKTNEDDTNTAYERATGRTDLPSMAVPVVQAALADERRHRAWIEQTLAQRD